MRRQRESVSETRVLLDKQSNKRRISMKYFLSEFNADGRNPYSKVSYLGMVGIPEEQYAVIQEEAKRMASGKGLIKSSILLTDAAFAEKPEFQVLEKSLRSNLGDPEYIVAIAYGAGETASFVLIAGNRWDDRVPCVEYESESFVVGGEENVEIGDVCLDRFVGDFTGDQAAESTTPVPGQLFKEASEVLPALVAESVKKYVISGFEGGEKSDDEDES